MIANMPAASASCRGRSNSRINDNVMAGLVPAVHVLTAGVNTWMPGPMPGTTRGSLEHGRRRIRPIRHERADARDDVCIGGSRLHAVLWSARRHQVFAWRRAHRRGFHCVGSLCQVARVGHQFQLVRACRYARVGCICDGVSRYGDRALSRDAFALGTGAQYPAYYIDAWHGPARMRAAVLPAGRKPETFSGAY